MWLPLKWSYHIQSFWKSEVLCIWYQYWIERMYFTSSMKNNIRRVTYYMQKNLLKSRCQIIYFSSITLKWKLERNTLKWKEFHFCFSFLHTLWNIFSDFGHILEPFHALLHQISKLYALCNPPRRLLIRKVIPILFDALTNDYFLASKCYQIGSFQHPSFV